MSFLATPGSVLGAPGAFSSAHGVASGVRLCTCLRMIARTLTTCACMIWAARGWNTRAASTVWDTCTAHRVVRDKEYVAESCAGTAQPSCILYTLLIRNVAYLYRSHAALLVYHTLYMYTIYTSSVDNMDFLTAAPRCNALTQDTLRIWWARAAAAVLIIEPVHSFSACLLNLYIGSYRELHPASHPAHQ